VSRSRVDRPQSLTLGVKGREERNVGAQLLRRNVSKSLSFDIASEGGIAVPFSGTTRPDV
jgi:hypothetical protein